MSREEQEGQEDTQFLHTLEVALELELLSPSVSLLDPRSRKRLSFLQKPTRFHTWTLAITTRHLRILIVHPVRIVTSNCGFPVILRPPVGSVSWCSDSGSRTASSSTGSSSLLGGRSPPVMSSKRCPKNSSKFTSFVRNSASASRQACLSLSVPQASVVPETP